jgi:hypothetical protein
MKAVYALYTSPEAAQRAVDDLRAAGIQERRITILSSEPLEEFEFGQRDRKTHMRGIAIFGGILGVTAAYLLTTVTQKLWPMNVGGMPTVANWANMIVMFELTMLGAVFATVFTLLVTARIPGRLPKLYDREISDGKILIGVANPKDPEVIENALRAGGRGTLKTIE